jgi:hypothetical protein
MELCELQDVESLEVRLHGIILAHLSKLQAYTIKKGRAKEDIIAAFRLETSMKSASEPSS